MLVDSKIQIRLCKESVEWHPFWKRQVFPSLSYWNTDNLVLCNAVCSGSQLNELYLSPGIYLNFKGPVNYLVFWILVKNYHEIKFFKFILSLICVKLHVYVALIMETKSAPNFGRCIKYDICALKLYVKICLRPSRVYSVKYLSCEDFFPCSSALQTVNSLYLMKLSSNQSSVGNKIYFYQLQSLRELASDISFRSSNGLVLVRQQAIMWTSDSQDQCYHILPLCHDELILEGLPDLPYNVLFNSLWPNDLGQLWIR